MSEINANIVVEPIDLNVTQTSINQNVTVEPITLGLFSTAPVSNPAAPDGALQYRANSTQFGGLANAIVSSGTLTFTNLANLSIAGGVNAYYLQTDGAGTLSWAAGGTPTGSGVPSGANTLIQLSDGSGSFDSGPGFSFDNISNVFSAPGQAIIAGNVDSTTGIFNGDGGGLSNITAANISGTVPLAAIAGTIANGTSNVDIATVNGNITMGVNNIADIVIVSDNSFQVTKTTSIQQAIEKATIVASSATGTINFNLLDQAIVYYTSNASGNFTLNIRGDASTTLNSVMAVGESMTLTFLNTNGATGYYASAIEIDGTPVTPKYSTGYTATGTENGIDALTLNIIKTATSTYTVLGSKIGFS